MVGPSYKENARLISWEWEREKKENNYKKKTYTESTVRAADFWVTKTKAFVVGQPVTGG